MTTDNTKTDLTDTQPPLPVSDTAAPLPVCSICGATPAFLGLDPALAPVCVDHLPEGAVLRAMSENELQFMEGYFALPAQGKLVYQILMKRWPRIETLSKTGAGSAITFTTEFWRLWREAGSPTEPSDAFFQEWEKAGGE